MEVLFLHSLLIFGNYRNGPLLLRNRLSVWIQVHCCFSVSGTSQAFTTEDITIGTILLAVTNYAVLALEISIYIKKLVQMVEDYFIRLQ